MNPTTITAIAGLITALTALIHAFNHSHPDPQQPPKENDQHGNPSDRAS